MDPEILRQKREAALKKQRDLKAKRALEQEQNERNVRLRGNTIVVNSNPNQPQSSNNTYSNSFNGRPPQHFSNNTNFANNPSRIPNQGSAPKIVTERVQEINSNKKKIKIKFSLVDGNTFTIIAEWDDQLNAFLKSQSIKYHERKFFFLLSNYKNILEKLKSFSHLDLDYEGCIPDFVFDMLQHFKPLRENDEEINLNERIETQTVAKLHGYQKEGIMFAIRLNARCFIADEMGLGKSVQALCAMKWFQEDWPLLILCTKTLVSKWKDDVRLWLTSLKESDIYIPKDSKQTLENTPITIMSYNMITLYEEQLKIDCKYRSMILDESHNVKDISSKRTKVCLDLAQRFMKHVILLSGTPVLNRPKELWSQFSMLYENFPKFPVFANRYCDPQKKMKPIKGNMILVTSYDGASNIEELNLLITNTFMIQRTKDEEMKSLPPKIREAIKLDINLGDKDLQLMNEHDKRLQNQPKITDDKTVPKAVIQWFQDTARVKAPAVVKRLEELIATKKKMIIFFHHILMMEAILEMLNRTQTSYIVISGATSTNDREKAVYSFQNKPNIRVALLSLKSCNTGLTLTAADTVVFAELYWTPSELHQAEARIHRIGQEKTCHCIYFYAKKTVDERIFKTLIEKLQVISQAGLKTDENYDNLLDGRNNQTTLDNFVIKASAKKNDTDEENYFDEDDGLDDLLRQL